MADNVIVNPSASYTVAAEDIGVSVEVQRVKIVLGTAGADGGNIGTTNPMPVSGTVTVPAGLSVSAQVSGTVTVANGLSVSAQVSGTVTVAAVSTEVSGTITAGTVLGTVAVNVVAGGAAPGSTAATQTAITAQVVWLAPTQTVTATVNTIAAGFSVQALVTGPVSISAMPAISISAVVPVTTAASVSVTGLPVWLNPTQTVAVSGLQGASVTGSVNIVSVAVVSVSAVVPVTTAASVSVTGLPVWLNPTQTVAVSGLVGHSITGSVNIVSVALVSVSAVVPVTTAASVSVTGIPVWMNPTQGVQVSGLSVTTATPAAAATGVMMWLVNTVTVTVTATVTGSLIISGVTPSTGAVPASAASVGIPVWPGILPVQPVMIVVTSTAIAQSAAIYAFTIWTGVIGAPAAAGTTAFAIPAGHTLRVLNVQGVINSSATTGGTVNVILLAVGATGSLVSASISTQLQVIKLQVLVSAGPVAASIVHGYGDVGAGTTIGVIMVGSVAAVLQQVAIMGYLF